MVNAVEMTLKNVDPILQKVLYHNAKEYIISKIYYNHMVVKMLTMQNYNVKLLQKGENQPRKKQDIDDIYENYMKIDDIDSEKANILNLELKNKENRDNKLMIDKYYFKKMCTEETPDDIKAELFYNYHLVDAKKHIIESLKTTDIL